MDHITVRHIVEAVSGTLLCGDADTELKHISIDSRSMRGADLFVPLIGEKSDAHRFLIQAMDNGAAAALTSEHEAAPEGFHGALIQVKDTKLALQTIGRCLRARLSIPLVGITGSGERRRRAKWWRRRFQRNIRHSRHRQTTTARSVCHSRSQRFLRMMRSACWNWE